MQAPPGKLKKYLWTGLTIALVLPQSACQIFNNMSEDEITTIDPVRVVVDGSSISPQQWSNLNDSERRDLENRFILIDQWISDANNWFIPYASRYIPELKSEGQKRLLPVINHDPLIRTLNHRDIAINLTAEAWQLTPDPLTQPLRETMVRAALKRSHLTTPPPPQGDTRQTILKSEYIQALFFRGVPTYISSFGTRLGDTPLLQALLGERDQIEDQFEVLRRPLRIDEKSTKAPDPEAVSAALDQIGVWICQRVESTLGGDAFIAAVDDGPVKLYEKYLATNPGIFMSLETFPVEVLPLPGQTITH